MTPAPTLLASLRGLAQTTPDATALAGSTGRQDFQTLWRMIEGGRTALSRAGAQPGDHVLLSAGNSTFFAAAYFAIHACRAVAVIVPPDTGAGDFADAIVRTRPVAVIADRDVAAPGIQLLLIDRLIETPPDPVERAEPALDDLADILFTTGTTGRRKAVALSHRNIATVAVNLRDRLQLDPTDLITVPLPLSHSFGLGHLRCMAVSGHGVHIERGMINPAGLIKRIEQFGATGLALVPAGFEIIRKLAADAFEKLNRQLKVIELGSAAIDFETKAWLIEAMPTTRILHHYGMTEASRAVFSDYRREGSAPGYVGRACEGVTLTITDESQRPLAAGLQGEIHVDGAIVSPGYWNDDGTLDTHRRSPAGFATGDFGSIDESGCLTLSGRLDDMINIGGRKVAPEEIEALLLKHPQVADACCTAMADPILGEAVAAHVVYRDGPADPAALLAWLTPQLDAHKVPRAIHAIDAVPRTASGKIQRARLRPPA